MKSYYIAHLVSDNEHFDLYIPKYEIEAFLNLTNLKVNDKLS